MFFTDVAWSAMGAPAQAGQLAKQIRPATITANDFFISDPSKIVADYT
jgi:hypothetical protein